MTGAKPAVPGSRARWVQLSEFLATVSASRTGTEAARAAIVSAGFSFNAAVVAVIDHDAVVDSLGLADVVPADGLFAAARDFDGTPTVADVPGVGRCEVLAAALPTRPSCALVVARPEPGYSHEDIVLVRSMARTLSVTLDLIGTIDEERALRESLEERRSLMDRLARIQRSIVHRAPLADVLHAICEGASVLTGDEVVGLRLLDPDSPDHLVMVADVGVSDEIRSHVSHTKLTEGVGGRAVLEENLVVADDYAAAPFGHRAFAARGLRAAMAAPVFEGGRVTGSLTVATYKPNRRYSVAEQEALIAFAEHASLALNDARTVDALHRTLREALHHATHDPLTGLPNRSILFEHLEEVLDVRRQQDHVALLFIDLDRFKAVNDSLGHDIGDRVLITVAQRLRAAVRPSDLVGRLAGDEFVVVCAGLHGHVDALGLADRISRELAAPIAVPGRDVVVTASIGVAQASDRSATADELLRDADMAMYRAKERGCDRVEVFGRDLRSAVRERLDVEHALRRAIAREEFRIEYQPVVNVINSRPAMVEALVRWDNDGCIISPAQFIPIAEETGLIVPIGGWVLRQACEQVASWRRDVPGLGALQVSVNVSMRQFAADDFVDLVASTLAASQLDPGALWLEVTESMLLDDVDDGIRTLLELKQLGVHLSIDDFGTGYSSLAYLRKFPVDVLKIDRSFVQNLGAEPEESAILAAIVALGRALGVGVVAEGIETAEQLAEVARLGIAAGQGFYFCRPKAAPEALEWLCERLTPALASALGG